MMKNFSSVLLKWYDRHKRDLPWRKYKDPYRIWLSEVMLQQTQVDTVIPYYERWLKKFPTIEAVSKATLDEILKQWEGLGYYARARNFKKACEVLCDPEPAGKRRPSGAKSSNPKCPNGTSARRASHERKKSSSFPLGDGSLVPQEPEKFSELPGVGPYITAAVQSIAFGHALPAIDGNLKRIVSRLKRIKKPPSKASHEIEEFLSHEISRKRPGDFNQALMDLGATICKPKDPLCLMCPVNSFCDAYHEGDMHRFPIPEVQKERPHYRIAVGVIWKNDKVLISKRKEEGLLGGLWEFPGGKLKLNETPEDCVRREIKEEVNVVVDRLRHVGRIKHAYTHFSIEVDGFICRYERGKTKALVGDDVRWVQFSELSQYAFPKANHKLFPLLPSRNPWRKGDIL